MVVCLSLLLSRTSITVPPIRARIPLTIKITPTNIPKKANPTSIPMLLRDSLAAVYPSLLEEFFSFGFGSIIFS
jgi:hypothetical protein